MEAFLYHGIRDYNLDKLINILQSGFILKRSELTEEYNKKDENEIDFNGENWISLTQKSLFDPYYDSPRVSSFDRFIYNHICLVLQNHYKDLAFTNFVDFDMYGSSYFRNITKGDSKERYSCFVDEVQTNKNIPVSDVIAIGYPKNYLDGKKDVDSDIERIKNTLNEIKLSIPIVDSSNYDFADNHENIKKYTI